MYYFVKSIFLPVALAMISLKSVTNTIVPSQVAPSLLTARAWK